MQLSGFLGGISMKPNKRPSSGIITVLAVIFSISHLGKIIKNVTEIFLPEQRRRSRPPFGCEDCRIFQNDQNDGGSSTQETA